MYNYKRTLYILTGMLCIQTNSCMIQALENELTTLRDRLNTLGTSLSAQVPLKPTPKAKPQPSGTMHPGLQVTGERTLPNGKKIIIGIGYLEKVGHVDAIVNAANANLIFGSGVAGSIATALGSQGVQQVYTEIRANNIQTPVPVGSATATKVPTGTTLSKTGFKYIIHAVGPNCNLEDQKNKWRQSLTSAYVNSLQEAKRLKLNSIIIPPLSIGVFKCPYQEALDIMMNTVVQSVNNMKSTDSLQEVILVVWKSGKNPELTALEWLKTLDKAIQIAVM